ncbi:MAG: hypothetical protein ACFFCS_00740 [Candidatus Hodarchaeota archaeon]
MSLEEKFKAFFSLDDRYNQNERTFLIKCIAWILIIRFLLIFWTIVFPDTRGTIGFLSTTNPLMNDSRFYYEIATQGYHEEMLVNFSPAFPVIMSIFNQIMRPFFRDPQDFQIFTQYTPFFLNTIFLVATPYFLLGFLKNIIKDEKKAKMALIVVLFNPIFFCYSIFGLTEPLHFLLLFIVLNSHYSRGFKHRIIEYACLVPLMLNRFINIVLAAFYLYKALLSKNISIKERILMMVPVLILGGVYFGWEFFCLKFFGITPSAARAEYWGHYFQLNPLSPNFALQLPLLLSGAVLGVTVLQSNLCKNTQFIEDEESNFRRIEIQALLAFVVITLLFLGAINLQISVLRYIGSLFPIFLIQNFELKTSKHLSIISFLVYVGMIISSIIAMPLIVFLTESGAIPSIKKNITATPLELILTILLSSILVICLVKFYLNRFKIKSIDKALYTQIMLAVLMMPLAIYFP